MCPGKGYLPNFFVLLCLYFYVIRTDIENNKL